MTRFKTLLTLIAIALSFSLTAGWSQAQESGPRGGATAETPVSTAFTYQGKLTDGGDPADGQYQFRFALHDDASADSSVGTTIELVRDVTDGLFTAELDFGDVFDGTALWLQIDVRPAGGGASYTPLDPRQPLNAAPYAHSLRPGATVGTTTGGVEASLGQGFVANVGSVAVYGHASFQGRGVYGRASNSDFSGFGVFGQHDGEGEGAAGFFRATAAHNPGLYAEAPETAIVGSAYTPTLTSASVLGQNLGDDTRLGAGVRGLAGDGEYSDIHPEGGWYAAGGEFAGPNGVLGVATDISQYGFGVAGISQGTGGRGVYGYASASTGVTYGVYGTAVSNEGYAGYFMGDAHVAGELTKSAGAFKIDHPLDPERKYLYHSFVESPQRTNVYNGNVTTGDDGYATVQLPPYFEALNRDYTYQLTVIRSFARAIVAQEIEDNQFVIQTDAPRVKVSWQVTGVRHDPYAEAHPFEDEVDKPLEEQGSYLHPELYGQTASQAIPSQQLQGPEGEQP